MNKLIFERDLELMKLHGIEIKEPRRIIFDLDINLTAQEFKVSCTRLAHAMGYTPTSVAEAFGVDNETGNPAQLKLLLS